ncbi:hypothetical protein HNY73_008369 [Argiope bruennichi]|uniref:Uncharacterized protein n=1 Tax=Argiope bruennichi TaxID=94029 RepID=A0A8T0FCM2_ARGBR|nr:hypothetical protein HNY73_008369 [Argiope bruennichi]
MFARQVEESGGRRARVRNRKGRSGGGGTRGRMGGAVKEVRRRVERGDRGADPPRESEAERQGERGRKGLEYLGGECLSLGTALWGLSSRSLVVRRFGIHCSLVGRSLSEIRVLVSPPNPTLLLAHSTHCLFTNTQTPRTNTHTTIAPNKTPQTLPTLPQTTTRWYIMTQMLPRLPSFKIHTTR